MKILCYLAVAINTMIFSGCIKEVNTSQPHPSKAYIINELSNSVSVIDLQKLLLAGKITVGEAPVSAAINRTTEKLYVANHAGNTVIDTKTDAVLTTVTTGDYPLVSGIDLARNKIYVPEG